MSSASYRPLRRFFTYCCAFFGAYTAYATIMVFVYAAAGDGPSNRESNACSSCHGNNMPANYDTLAIWGGAFHDWSRDATGGGNFGGVPSGFRM